MRLIVNALRVNTGVLIKSCNKNVVELLRNNKMLKNKLLTEQQK